jgi:excinuclease ABC subunit B
MVTGLVDGVYSNAAQKAMVEGAHGMADAEATAKVESMSEKQISKEIKRLEKLMVDHAKNLEFEKAAQVRDQLHVLKQQAFGRRGRTMWCRCWGNKQDGAGGAVFLVLMRQSARHR